MMTTNSGPSAIFLRLHEQNALLNDEIKAFKRSPGDLSLITTKLSEIGFTLQKIGPSVQLAEDRRHLEIINMAFEQTKTRVAKLAVKFPSFATPTAQIADLARKQGYISFYDDQMNPLTGFLGNFHRCPNEIEFGGQKYSSSDAIFQSHRSSGQPFDVMMNALRAKFGQNPALKEMLMATGNAYLVEESPGQRCLTDQDMLGICLMRLRGECGGCGEVGKPATYVAMLKPQVLAPARPTFSAQTLTTPSQKIADLARNQGFISFYDDQTDSLTGCFGNFHQCPNLIEFDGNKYANSEAIFQSRKFTDQPGIFAQFSNQVDGDRAVRIARDNKMTPTRLKEWDDLQQPGVNKVDVMMDALRAKFGQNPALKEMLMATGDAYLVEHLPDAQRRDRFWSDGFDGSGPNYLGECMMRIRGEYGGTGAVAKPRSYLLMLQSQSSVISAPTVPQALIYNLLVPQLGNPSGSLSNRCVHCHEREKYVERDTMTGTIKRVHDYCGRTCAQKAGALNN